MTIQEIFARQQGTTAAATPLTSVEQEQEKYALVTVPKIISKVIMGEAEMHMATLGGQQMAAITKRRAEFMLNDLIQRVQEGRWVEEMCCKEGVASRFLEQSVQKIQLMTLGTKA